MVKFQKLTLNKRYLIKTNKSYFIRKVIADNEFICKIKEINNKEVTFYSNKKILDENVECYDRYKIFSKKFFYKHFIGIITLILILIILSTSKLFIREIKFKNTNYYSEDVYQEVIKYLDKVGPFYVLNENLSTISLKLRNTFPEYAWIGITRNSSLLVIDIETQDVPIKQIEDLTITGDIVSKFDSIVTDIIVRKGVVLVMKNQSVKKGDVLISGNLKYYNDPSDKSTLVKSQGFVIGKTMELEKIKVPIKTNSTEYSGNVKTVRYFEFLGKVIGKNHVTFDNYKTEINEILNIFNIIKVTDLMYYELVEVYRENDETTAYELAEMMIKSEFEQNRVSNHEKIDSLELVNISREDNYYIVSVIVKKHQNLGVFIQH